MTLLPMLAAGSSYLCGCMGVCAGCAAVSRVLPAICVTREIACCTVVAERKAKLQARKQGCVSAGAGRCGTLLSRSKQDRAVCRGRPSPPPLAPPAVTPPTLVAPPPHTHTQCPLTCRWRRRTCRRCACPPRARRAWGRSAGPGARSCAPARAGRGRVRVSAVAGGAAGPRVGAGACAAGRAPPRARAHMRFSASLPGGRATSTSRGRVSGSNMRFST